MATQQKTSNRNKETGSTLYGALAGLLIGLIAAAAVAFYITKAPIPFVDHASRNAQKEPDIDPRNPPDPNQALYSGKDVSKNTLKPDNVPDPEPSDDKDDSPPDDLGALIATLSQNPEPNKPTIVTQAPQSKTSSAKPQSPPASGKYYLQAGAFKAETEAESVRARIILLGFPVAIQRAEVNGTTVNRVRLGPFKGLDDMNVARNRLGQNKIATTVVRQ